MNYTKMMSFLVDFSTFYTIAGAFLLPYILLAVVFGIPMSLPDTSIGQFTQEGSSTCWNNLCPLGQGEIMRPMTRDPVSREKNPLKLNANPEFVL